MTEPFRDRFAAFGLRIAARPFTGQGGRPLWFADGQLREPNPATGKTGAWFQLDLITGEWRFDGSAAAPHAPFDAFGPAWSLKLAQSAAPPERGVVPEPPASSQPAQATALPTFEDLPAAQAAWLHECQAAGFDIDPSPNFISGWESGNRRGTYKGITELLSSRTRTILGMFCRKWSLAEYLAMRAGQNPDEAAPCHTAAEDPPFEPTEPSQSTRAEFARLIRERPFAVPMPSEPRPTVQRSLFA